MTDLVFSIILYIDPGTGSLLFQILSAVVIAILFYFSLLKKMIYNFFSKLSRFFTGKVKTTDE